jgi:hypothetical protein
MKNKIMMGLWRMSISARDADGQRAEAGTNLANMAFMTPDTGGASLRGPQAAFSGSRWSRVHRADLGMTLARVETLWTTAGHMTFLYRNAAVTSSGVSVTVEQTPTG